MANPLVAFSLFSNFVTGSANSLSRKLPTDKFDAPHTWIRNGFGFAEETEVNWRIISIKVWVFPVPSAPGLDSTPPRGRRLQYLAVRGYTQLAAIPVRILRPAFGWR